MQILHWTHEWLVTAFKAYLSILIAAFLALMLHNSFCEQNIATKGIWVAEIPRI